MNKTSVEETRNSNGSSSRRDNHAMLKILLQVFKIVLVRFRVEVCVIVLQLMSVQSSKFRAGIWLSEDRDLWCSDILEDRLIPQQSPTNIL